MQLVAGECLGEEGYFFTKICRIHVAIRDTCETWNDDAVYTGLCDSLPAVPGAHQLLTNSASQESESQCLPAA